MTAYKNPIIALCQLKGSSNPKENVERAIEFIIKSKSQGADMVVLPEMFICPYNNQSFKDNKMSIDSTLMRKISDCAKEQSVWIIAGSIPESDDSCIYNTSLVFDRSGKTVARHRKVHMFDIDIPGKIRFVESETLTPGNDMTIFDTEFGKFGLGICFDIRFVEFFRLMAINGVKGIFVPAAFNMTTGPAHWEITARMRALDNQLYIFMCSPARDVESSYIAYGHSLIANPWGEVIESLDEKEGILIKEVDLQLIDRVRLELPVIKGRRTDVYEISYKGK